VSRVIRSVSMRTMTMGRSFVGRVMSSMVVRVNVRYRNVVDVMRWIGLFMSASATSAEMDLATDQDEADEGYCSVPFH
jgi:hypothetical protein